MAKASTHGKKFSLTGGMHLTSDDILISSELALRQKDKARLTAKKSRWQRQSAVEVKAKLVLDARANGDDTCWKVAELDALLAWYKVPNTNKLDKAKKIEKWKNICEKNLRPPLYEAWTDEDENALMEASREDLNIGDTALGRLEKKRKQEFIQSARSLTEEEWSDLTAARSMENATRTGSHISDNFEAEEC